MSERVLGRIFGPMWEEQTCGWRKVHNEGLYGLYFVLLSGWRNETEMAWACNTRGKYEKCIQNFGGDT
jgi:hypothetical protein